MKDWYTLSSTEHGDLPRRVMRSTYWMLLNSGAVKALGFLTQVVLALLLAKEDFGVFALAMALSALLTNFRGGGMLQWFIQGGRVSYEDRSGPVFWLSTAFNLLLGALICTVAIPAGQFLGDSQIGQLVLITGAAFPLLSFGAYYKSCLAIDLRMKEVTQIEIAGTTIRSLLMVGLAIAGFGPLSFVLPLPVSHAVEGLLGYRFIREQPWRKDARVREWAGLIWRTRWILAGTFVITLGLQADYLVLGQFISLASVGVYFFAYQMTFMSASIITNNVRRVLTPALVAVPDDRVAAAAVAAARTTLTFGAPILLVLACIIEPAESLIWSGKWADAVVPVQVMCLGLPLQLLTMVTQASLNSSGNFRLWTAVNSVRAAFTVVGAGVAGTFFADDISMIAAVMAGSFALANLIQVRVAFGDLGVRTRELLPAIWQSVALGPLVVVVVLLLTEEMRTPAWATIIIAPAIFLVAYLAVMMAVARTNLRSTVHALLRSR